MPNPTISVMSRRLPLKEQHQARPCRLVFQASSSPRLQAGPHGALPQYGRREHKPSRLGLQPQGACQTGINRLQRAHIRTPLQSVTCCSSPVVSPQALMSPCICPVSSAPLAHSQSARRVKPARIRASAPTSNRLLCAVAAAWCDFTIQTAAASLVGRLPPACHPA